VAVRLAVAKPSNPRQTLYRTIARSSGLNQNRGNTSEDILATEGIPWVLSENDHSGVLIYNDLDEAIQIGAFKETANEKRYPNEIASMMVAPLNAWQGEKQGMIGILYVTSPAKDAFSAKDVDAVCFIADLLANSIAITVQNLESV
jgi:hypothetical protein